MEKTLKERIRAGGSINVACATMRDTKQTLEARLSRDAYDLVFIDTQHCPVDENAIAAFCGVAEELGMPVTLRVRHPSDVNMIGHWLDLGPLSIVVPQVESRATALAAVESFYFPPLGKRSWGPGNAYQHRDKGDLIEYAKWWNDNGVLIFQIESIEGVENARDLVVPGLDLLTFGGNDLALSLAARPDYDLGTFEECRRRVLDGVKDTGIKVAANDSPLGIQ